MVTYSRETSETSTASILTPTRNLQFGLIVRFCCSEHNEFATRVASRVLCEFEKGFSFPGGVEVRDDAVDDAVAALQIGEAGHGTGTAAHFAEGAFDDIGGA